MTRVELCIPILLLDACFGYRRSTHVMCVCFASRCATLHSPDRFSFLATTTPDDLNSFIEEIKSIVSSRMIEIEFFFTALLFF